MRSPSRPPIGQKDTLVPRSHSLFRIAAVLLVVGVLSITCRESQAPQQSARRSEEHTS